jgi:hypothetical protein
MSTIFELWNNSGNNGGACTVSNWQVEFASGAKTTNEHNLMTGKTQAFNLSSLGWDTATNEGQNLRIRADISAGSQSIHSPYVPYKAGTTVKFEVSGPSAHATIDGPIT